MNKSLKNILIVDDHESFRETLALAFKNNGYTVNEAEDAETCLKLIESNEYNLIISDFRMPKVDGLELLDRINLKHPEIPVILITGFSTNELISKALKKGAVNFFKKPFSINDLLNYCDSLLRFVSEISNSSLKNIKKITNNYDKRLVVKSKEKIIDYVPNFILNDLIDLGYLLKDDFLPFSTALIEALSNSLYHGNFGIDSDIRNSGLLNNQKLFKQKVFEEENNPDNDNKSIIIECFCTDQLIKVSIEDQGKGFDWKEYSENPVKMYSGKGLFLIKSLVDKVEYNESGNKITLYKYKK